MSLNPGFFTVFIKKNRESGHLVVQPRMGFGTKEKMSSGLKAVKQANAPTIGTLTIDSYTRVNNYEAAKKALEDGHDLNGYPIVTHGAIKTREMLRELQGKEFPIQIRHGTALPLSIFKTMLDAGIDATEGGPISYCLPYSRVPLEKTILAWGECCRLLSNQKEFGVINHLESFAGCMMGQLCPPSLLIALGILEGLFFKKHGLVSLSISLTQGTNREQDIAALEVIHQLATEHLVNVEWHIVFYSYMGVFPQTVRGAFEIIRESARIAKAGKAARLIVKTPAEAHRIPTIEENVASLEFAFETSERNDFLGNYKALPEDKEEIYREAKQLIESVLDLNTDLEIALLMAFQKGYLDVPYCLHFDNKNKTRAYINDRGYLKWSEVGNMPISCKASDSIHNKKKSSSDNLLEMLNYNQKRFDDNKLYSDLKE